jgi:PKD repeat protein
MAATGAMLMRRCAALAAFLVLAVAAMPASSSAGAAHNPHGRFLGVVPSKVAGGSPFAPRRAPTSNLSNHGGPVVHGSHVYAIYWAPSGYSFPSDYTSSIDSYFGNVAADSGKSTNVYSVARQYADGVGPTSYQVTFGGSYTDTDPFPTSDCTGPGSLCLTDQQLTGELDSFISAHSLPRGMTNLYFLFTPPNVGSCFDNTSLTCAFNYYCGYHSDFVTGAGTVLYANEPYVSGVYGCDSGESPTGTTGDGTINVVSHEHIEIATDPLGNAWYDDASGDEIADKCGFDFGSPLGSADSGGLYNQLIGGGQYYLQQEWSNSDGACVQNMAAAGPAQPPIASFTHSGGPIAGQLVTFDASQSNDPDGTILGYSWNYGDGSTGTGKFPFHAYAASGTYQVTLTTTDDDGMTGSNSAPITVAPAASSVPPETKPAAPIAPANHPVAKKKKHKKKKHKKHKKHKKKRKH